MVYLNRAEQNSYLMNISPKAAYWAVVALLVVVPLLYFGYQDFENSKRQAEPWLNPIITKKEFAALEWVKRNTQPRTTFA